MIIEIMPPVPFKSKEEIKSELLVKYGLTEGMLTLKNLVKLREKKNIPYRALAVLYGKSYTWMRKLYKERVDLDFQDEIPQIDTPRAGFTQEELTEILVTKRQPYRVAAETFKVSIACITKWAKKWKIKKEDARYRRNRLYTDDPIVTRRLEGIQLIKRKKRS
jgi:hypothetical protein